MNTGNVVKWTIRELISNLNTGKLVLQPHFQRRLVWNNQHKERFINTILCNYPFPEIYIAREYSNDSKMLIVDGQQRINTINQYVTGDLQFKEIAPFFELGEEKIEEFLDYIIVVRDLGVLEKREITEIFNRINSVSYALKAIELQNALYSGEYITTANEILNDNPFDNLEVFDKAKTVRMQDLEFVLLIMTTLEINGYFTGNKELEYYIKRYDNDYPNKEKMKGLIISTLQYLYELNLPADSLWLRKSSFFTLIVETAKFYRDNDFQFPELQKYSTVLIELENKILSNKHLDYKENIYARFYNYIFQATASRVGRLARSELFEKLFNNELKI
ncbi:DUF262 domain-containing protein [Schinkia azotoformans]|uniref:DUF262 domain-containing protein n=1 Tax=Schinkia azotoformans TaxID=1454 RepID=UPI002DBFB9A6|nr:DUF262 domain-containing protein [Schinkia azotoformans]MEC1698027.1 DUF262 domain-containing protein [Schinkia azotoformans]